VTTYQRPYERLNALSSAASAVRVHSFRFS
jgi:hypothetical protein